jgi:glutathione S-transferase
MSIIPNLYHRINCYKTNTIELVNQFIRSKYEKIIVDELAKEDLEKVIKKSPIGNIPLYQVGDFFLSGTKAIIQFILSSNKGEVSEILLKSNNYYEKALVEMWSDFIISNLWVILEIIFTTEKDKLILNDKSEVFTEAKNDLFSVLEKINSHLVFQTYMVGSSMSLADLMLASCLTPVFEHLFSEEDFMKFSNLTRWFKLNSNIKEFKNVFGEAKLSKSK